MRLVVRTLLLLLLPSTLGMLKPASPSSETQTSLEFSVLGDSCNTIAIPYPFGQSNSWPGFEVVCNNSLPFLRAGQMSGSGGGGGLQILNISIEEGYVRVLLSPLARQCGRSSSPSSPYTISLQGTPYTYSHTRNKLTVIGCDAMALLYDTSALNDTPDQHYSSDHIHPNTTGDYYAASGCVSFCTPLPRDVVHGLCSGFGCCQAPLPSGLKQMLLNVSSITALTHSKQLTKYTCSQVFLVDQDNFTFDQSELSDLSGSGYRPVVLDWAIGSDKCAEAKQKNESEYACKENSACYDSPIGYRCICNLGYTGNPYVRGGCQDKDECIDSPCKWKCINEEGGFHCSCPLLWQGDGLRNGSGCTMPRTFDIGLSVGSCVVAVSIIGGIFTYRETKRRSRTKLKQKNFMRNGGLLLQQHTTLTGSGPRIFNIEEMEEATNKFHLSTVVGRGGYGTVYRGTLPDETVVAIKKSKVMDESQIEQFINEVAILSMISHPHVVKLLGCCLETQVPLLVYEFISNGNLFHYVHETSSSAHLSWENRLRIAVETAQALAYLHSKSSIPIVHRDVKSANILLDENYSAKVSDFGASRLVPLDQTHVTTLVQGTLGYLDPEYFYTSQLTEKSDVFSFGIVLVELLTSEKPVVLNRAEKNLAAYFLMLLEENQLLEAVDYRILNEAGELHVLVVAQIAKRCLNLKGEERPTMTEVVIELNALRKLMLSHRHQHDQEERLYIGKPLSIEGIQSNDVVQDYEDESYLLP